MSTHEQARGLPQTTTLAKTGNEIQPLSQRKGSQIVKQIAKVPRARWILIIQAHIWRRLMSLGMLIHRMAPPHPPKPAFARRIPAKLSGQPGYITLHIYTPSGYETQRRHWKDKPIEPDETSKDSRRKSVISQVGDSIKRRSSVSRKWGSYPVVINFHGGGFTLGTATDDGRWCGTVVDECQAVVVSVDYRLAPEHPFPTAVEDGADAVVWVHQHAEELGIDRNKIALSGFSSGGNMAFTVPLRLHDELTGFARDDDLQAGPSAGRPSGIPSSSHNNDHTGDIASHDVVSSATRDPKSSTQVTSKDVSDMSDITIRAIVPWYPSLDYTRTREQRRATNVRKDQELSALFTDLFDESYLHPPKTISLDSPYLSPGVANDSLLKYGLPQDIILHTCEWDMLLDEGKAFHRRLISPPLNKNVFYKMVEGVPHGWDKAPNPWKPTPGVREHYLRACKELRRIFNPVAVPERSTEDGPSAAPRKSIQFVR
ncbi:hypothetical protein AMS68_001167 [Peltaster fructicola]|uniref:Alpha/beta hydrolase fold-3 domain-containing protein n=1 Tax=Peltaster fructicola TaxID=286661 RepID=A0A6H0XMC6_9PEZI|nr:hypothetical protein AMS68_001167 [Peltaster fructicola]